MRADVVHVRARGDPTLGLAAATACLRGAWKPCPAETMRQRPTDERGSQDQPAGIVPTGGGAPALPIPLSRVHWTGCRVWAAEARTPGTHQVPDTQILTVPALVLPAFATPRSTVLSLST